MDHIARKVEKELLDTYYKEFELIKYSRTLSVPYLLKVYGDFERHWSSMGDSGHSDYSIRSFLFNAISGISNCLKWVNESSTGEFQTLPDSDKWNEILVDFVTWGMDYYLISQQYVAYSRNLIGIEVTESNKLISFILPTDRDLMFSLKQQFLYTESIPKIYSEHIDEMRRSFKRWFDEMKQPVQPPLASEISWMRIYEEPLYSRVLNSARKELFEELPSNTDLGGYSLNDFIKFYAALFIGFNFIGWIEGVMDQKFASDHPFGSNPLDGDPETIYRFFSWFTKVPTQKVNSIIQDLTFDYDSFHASIIIQPFIKSKENRLFILPNLFAHNDPRRMLAGALNKGIKKPIYDRLINDIECAFVQKIMQLAGEIQHFKLIRRKTFTNKGKTLTPDITLFDTSSGVLLIIEYKHYLVPISTSEVDYRLKEVKKGLTRLNEYVEYAKLHIKAILQEERIEIKENYTVAGLLLFHQPMPLPIEKGEAVFITDYGSFRKEITANPNGDILHVLQSMKSYQPADFIGHKFKKSNREIMVKDWTFRWEVLASTLRD